MVGFFPHSLSPKGHDSVFQMGLKLAHLSIVAASRNHLAVCFVPSIVHLAIAVFSIAIFFMVLDQPNVRVEFE